MERKHKIVNLAAVLLLLLVFAETPGSIAAPSGGITSPAGGIASPAGSLAASPVAYKSVAAGTGSIAGSTAGEIIPSARRIDWSYAGIPGGIPERTAICATINSAQPTAMGQPTRRTPSRMRSTAARTGRWCTCQTALTGFQTRSTCTARIPCAAPDPARPSSSTRAAAICGRWWTCAAWSIGRSPRCIRPTMCSRQSRIRG